MKYLLLILALLLPASALANATILINELAWMGTTVSSNDEWIELYNSSDQPIVLDGFTLKAIDGSPSITLTGTIAPRGYFLLERTDDDTVPTITADQIYSGSLGNTGEHLQLFDANNALVDEIIATGEWPGGDNTTKQTLERTINGWQTSAVAGGTPKAQNSNSTTTPPDDNPPNNDGQDDTIDEDLSTNKDATTGTTKAKKGDIVFTELLPAPTTDQTEFIEITNASQSWIDLTDWTITNNGKQTFTLPSLIMTPSSTAIFYRDQTKLALNNIKETLKLKRGATIIDQISYTNAPGGLSYARNDADKWQWTNALSEGEKNNLPAPPPAPESVIYGPKETTINTIISFDGTDSIGHSNAPLSYYWEFGDGFFSFKPTPNHAYTTPGKYEIVLTVYDQALAASSTAKIIVANPNSATTTIPLSGTAPSTIALGATTTAYTTGNTRAQAVPDIFISEFLPDPEGSDTDTEFIELYNNEPFPIDLTDWQLDDTEGGSRPFTFPQTIIGAGQYLVVFRTQSKLALNNDEDEVRLLLPDDVIVDAVRYDDTTEGTSYALDDRFVWQISATPTPGEINLLAPTPPENASTTPINAVPQPQVLGTAIETTQTPNNKQPSTRTLRGFLAGGLTLMVGGTVWWLRRRSQA